MLSADLLISLREKLLNIEIAAQLPAHALNAAPLSPFEEEMLILGLKTGEIFVHSLDSS